MHLNDHSTWLVFIHSSTYEKLFMIVKLSVISWSTIDKVYPPSTISIIQIGDVS